METEETSSMEDIKVEIKEENFSTWEKDPLSLSPKEYAEARLERYPAARIQASGTSGGPSLTSDKELVIGGNAVKKEEVEWDDILVDSHAPLTTYTEADCALVDQTATMAEMEKCRAARTPFTSQSKGIVLNVLQYLRNKMRFLNETELELEAAEATGVSARSIKRFKKELKEGGLRSPPTKKKRLAPIMNSLDTFDEACVRRIVAGFYDRGEIPTLETLLERVKEVPVNFKGGKSSLHKILINMGFRYKKVTSGRKILMERDDIVLSRNEYLRKIKENRDSDNPRPEIFLDETRVNKNECVGKIGHKVKTGRDAHFIVLHAGGVDGFVPDSLLMFQSQNGNDSMSHDTFLSWFKSQLLVNIPQHSLIIMDDASYHRKLLNKAPTQSTRRPEIIKWLEDNTISHNPAMTKPELLDNVKRNIHKQMYMIDELALQHGHQVLRLPPYHCELNPIELIWAEVKGNIRLHDSDGDQSLQSVEYLTKTAIEKVSKQNWQECILHTQEIEDEFRRNDRVVNHLIKNFTINLEETSSEEDE